MPEVHGDSDLAEYVRHVNWWLRLQGDVVRYTVAALLIKMAKSPLATGSMGDLVLGNLSYLIAAGVVVWKPIDEDRNRIELPDRAYRMALARCSRSADGCLVLRPEKRRP